MTPSPLGLVQQANIAALGFSVLALSLIVGFILNGNRAMLTEFLFRVGMFVVISTISVYAINCTIVGSCHLFAWVLGYVIAVFGTTAVVASLFMRR